MNKTAFLFPGQGSQIVGMGLELRERFAVARAVFDEADEALGFPLSQIIFEGPDATLKLTEHTQPAILTTSIAAERVLREAGVHAAMAAGHSLGEYSAHVAAGTMSFANAVRAVRLRGRYMQEAVPPGEGAMAAVLGLDAKLIEVICEQVQDQLTPLPGSPIAEGFEAKLAVVSAANLNSPAQTVISGAAGAVESAAALCRQAGAKKTVMLPVSAPFHCALMQPAQDRLAADLANIEFRDPAILVAANVSADLITSGDEARTALIAQVTGAVRWVECIELLVREGATHFVEVGPGRVLSGLMRQILGKESTLPVFNVEDVASFEKTLDGLGNQQG